MKCTHVIDRRFFWMRKEEISVVTGSGSDIANIRSSKIRFNQKIDKIRIRGRTGRRNIKNTLPCFERSSRGRK